MDPDYLVKTIVIIRSLSVIKIHVVRLNSAVIILRKGFPNRIHVGHDSIIKSKIEADGRET